MFFFIPRPNLRNETTKSVRCCDLQGRRRSPVQNAGLPDLGGWHEGLVPVLQVLVQGLGFGIKNEYDAPGVLHDRENRELKRQVTQ